LFVGNVITVFRVDEVTLKDVQNVIGRRGKCHYYFQTQSSNYGVVKKEVNQPKILISLSMKSD